MHLRPALAALLLPILLLGCPELSEPPPPATTSDPPPAYSTDEDLGAPPPAGTPSAAEKSDWTPSGTVAEVEPAAPKAVEIDPVALENADPLPGGEFNKFFPKQGGEYDLVYKQEKQGTAIASWQRDGEEVATLTITDLAKNASAAEKFRSAEESVDGFPVTKSGSKGTVALVAGRFQVQVRSAEGQLDHADRKRLLADFDLDGVAGLID